VDCGLKTGFVTRVAQPVERTTVNRDDDGSNPSAGVFRSIRNHQSAIPNALVR
jgi:hypothetical protein